MGFPSTIASVLKVIVVFSFAPARHGADLLVPKPGIEHEPAWWLLSLFQPGDTESVDWTRGRYEVTTRTGRVESNAGWGALKKTSRMVTEGSVLLSDFPLRGSAPDVAPDGFSHETSMGVNRGFPTPLDG